MNIFWLQGGILPVIGENKANREESRTQRWGKTGYHGMISASSASCVKIYAAPGLVHYLNEGFLLCVFRWREGFVTCNQKKKKKT